MTLKQIAQDFGISEASLTNWLKAADVEAGKRPGVTSREAAELRELKRGNRLLERRTKSYVGPRPTRPRRT